MPKASQKPLNYFGENVEAAWKAAGFRSRAAALKEAKLDQMTVHRWIFNAEPPSPRRDLLERLADVLNTTPEALTRKPIKDVEATREEEGILRRVLPPDPTRREIEAVLAAIRAARENPTPPDSPKDEGARAADRTRAARHGVKRSR